MDDQRWLCPRLIVSYGRSFPSDGCICLPRSVQPIKPLWVGYCRYSGFQLTSWLNVSAAEYRRITNNSFDKVLSYSPQSYTTTVEDATTEPQLMINLNVTGLILTHASNNWRRDYKWLKATMRDCLRRRSYSRDWFQWVVNFVDAL